MYTLYEQLLNGLPNVVAAILILLLAFISAAIAKSVAGRLMKLLKFDALFEKAGLDEERRTKTKNFIEKLSYLIIFLLWMPGFFEKLGINGVASPIISMMEKTLSYIPNIIASILILIVGLFIAKTVKEIVLPLFRKLEIDEKLKKIGIDSQNNTSVAEVLANTIYVIIIIPIVIAALNSLKIDAISQPAIDMLNMIFAFIPKILLAIIIFFVGNFIAKLVYSFLIKTLESVGLDKVTKSVFDNTGTKVKNNVSLSNIIANIVRYVIIIFFVVEAINALELDVLTNVGNGIIGYLPYALSAIVMLGIAILVGNYVQKVMLKSFPESKGLAMFLKVLIIVIGAFITLHQLGIATTLVNAAFIILFGTAGITFAMSVGVSSREFTKNRFNDLEKTLSSKKK